MRAASPVVPLVAPSSQQSRLLGRVGGGSSAWVLRVAGCPLGHTVTPAVRSGRPHLHTMTPAARRADLNLWITARSAARRAPRAARRAPRAARRPLSAHGLLSAH